MDFNLSAEQNCCATAWQSSSMPATPWRAAVAAKTGAGWQPEVWRSFAEELASGSDAARSRSAAATAVRSSPW